jgi:hypothetical protein
LFFALLLFAFFQKRADEGIISAEQKRIEELESELTVAEKSLQQILPLADMSPQERDQFFNELVPAIQLEVKNEKLEEEIKGLHSQLEELADVETRLEKLAQETRKPRAEIRRALKLWESIKESVDVEDIENSAEATKQAFRLAAAVNAFNGQSDTPITDEQDLLNHLQAASRASAFQRENDDLRGQVVNLRGRLGGRDLPPCWANKENGKIEYLFNIEILDDGLLISAAAPDHRLQEYRALPNTNHLTSGLIDLEMFKRLALPILQVTESRECRHYVSITDKSENAYKSTLTIEDYFYKYVNRI